MLKKILFIFLASLIPLSASASILGIQQGGTATSSFSQGWLSSSGGFNYLTASTSPTVNYLTATSTTASSTLPNLVVTAISIASEYISNFTVYTRSLFSATGVISYNSSTGAFTCPTCLSGTVGVGNGGTGATTFGQGWINSSGGTSALSASTSPTVNYLTATSTATSTFSGEVKVYKRILNVDYVDATSSSMTLSLASSTSHTIRMGAGTMTITLADATEGSVLRAEVCNPGTSAGALTWASNIYLRWSGGTAPTQTTTANACDLWTFSVTSGTSTPFIHGAQIPW